MGDIDLLMGMQAPVSFDPLENKAKVTDETDKIMIGSGSDDLANLFGSPAPQINPSQKV